MRLVTERRACAAYARDFSRALARVPQAVAHCTSPEDVRTTLRLARERSLPVTVRAGGLSGHGQALGEGIVLIPPRPAQPIAGLDGDVVRLDAGARWADVHAALRARGRAVPVLPAHLDTSVGGTLAVGGYGVRSCKGGNQLDHVVRIRLLRPDGSAVWCSRDEHAELFGLALGSLGQLGVVERVELRTAPAALSTVYRRGHESFGALAAWLPELPPVDGLFAFASRADFLGGRVAAHVALDDGPPGARPGGAVLVGERRDLELTLDGDVRRWLAAFRSHVRLFTDVVVDRRGLLALADWLDRVVPTAQDLQGVYLLAARNGATFPFDGRFGSDEQVYGLGLYALVPDGDAERRAQAEALLATVTSRCLGLGGRPFLWGWQRLSDAQLAATYGAAHARLAALRREADPGGLLNRGALNGPRAAALAQAA